VKSTCAAAAHINAKAEMMSDSAAAFDPSVFDPANADAENRALNAAMIVKLSSLPDQR
jgi:hypothetical protein